MKHCGPRKDLFVETHKFEIESDRAEVPSHIELTVEEALRLVEKIIDLLEPTPFYELARAYLLVQIAYGDEVIEAAKALKCLERAQEIRVDRDTPTAFIEHAKRLLDTDGDCDVVALAQQAADEYGEDEDD